SAPTAPDGYLTAQGARPLTLSCDRSRRLSNPAPTPPSVGCEVHGGGVGAAQDDAHPLVGRGPVASAQQRGERGGATRLQDQAQLPPSRPPPPTGTSNVSIAGACCDSSRPTVPCPSSVSSWSYAWTCSAPDSAAHASLAASASA